MRRFSEIHELASRHKGGEDALERLLQKPKSKAELEKIAPDRWLSEMTRCVFQAGFNWALIDRKWPDFEDVFEGFDVNRWTLMSDEDVERLAGTGRIVANIAKIRSVGANAVFLNDLVREHGSVGAAFSGYPPERYIDLLGMLKKRANRMGGNAGQIFLRRMGVDALIFSGDVVAALVREGVVDKAPTSKRDLEAVQDALNAWRAESGRSLNEVSQILAFSTGPH
ncbi:DNA-3-methyladenine glycosylase I [Rhizobiales bacterium]|uniref:DNA-3-methyladenine glycosylase I n=1 Tax=Hongsoonwoonella zoysiae TaxID=2821844 RepID=UPI00155F54DF|nr:DNA-3-methyladenine glycosylase I [Hongsoonwoonella zoysiae]NRG17937.1 DNA-3-methyladenine glycosylase I [Hongsoonwoonella zoysiae]